MNLHIDASSGYEVKRAIHAGVNPERISLSIIYFPITSSWLRLKVCFWQCDNIPQVQSRPPTVAVFCNNPKYFTNNYKLYLDRKFREQLGFVGTPLRFLWRGKSLRRVEQETGIVADRGRSGGRELGYPKPHAR